VDAATANFPDAPERSFLELNPKYAFVTGGECHFEMNGSLLILHCDTNSEEQATAQGELRELVDAVLSCPGPKWKVVTSTDGSVIELHYEDTGVTLLFEPASVPAIEPKPHLEYYVSLSLKGGPVRRLSQTAEPDPAKIIQRRQAAIDRLPDSDPEKLLELESAAEDYSKSVTDLPVGLSFIRQAVHLQKEQLKDLVHDNSLSGLDELQDRRGYFDNDLLLNIDILLRLNGGILKKEEDVDEVLDLVQWRRRALGAEALKRSIDRLSLPSDVRSQAETLERMRIEWRRTASDLMQARVQGSDSIAQLVQQLNSAERSFRAASDRLLALGSGYGGLYGDKSLKLSDVQHVLRSNEVLVIFARSEFQGPWVVVISQRAARVQDLSEGNPTGANGLLMAAMQRFQTSFALQNAAFDYADSSLIYHILLAPLEDILAEHSRLIVIPDVSFPAIAYPALLTAPGDKTTPSAQLSWLVKRHSLSLALGVQSFVAVRSHPSAPATAANFLGFADPVFDKVDPRCPPISLIDVVTNPSSPTAGVLCPLPETLDHVVYLAKGLAADPAATIVSEQNFTLDAVSQRVRRPTHVIAFATHGLVTEEARRIAGVNEPALLLSPTVGGRSTDENRWLTTSKIEALPINADLVFLSACNTSAEGERRGEAFSGLARAFFQAGARGVVVTNWFIDVFKTAQFLAKMEAHWSEFSFDEFPEILQRTMLDSLDTNSDPRTWAVFTLVGG
jgi:CHAT domain-containing protein